jgi:hypothetical protein
MNVKRFVMASVAAFVFVFAFEFLLHGILLKNVYEATSNLWRPMGSGTKYMMFMWMSQAGFSAVAAFLFTRHYEAKGIGEGVRFGLYVGLLLASIEVGTYCYLPIPVKLTLAWVVGGLLKGLGTGIAVSLVYKNQATTA